MCLQRAAFLRKKAAKERRGLRTPGPISLAAEFIRKARVFTRLFHVLFLLIITALPRKCTLFAVTG